MLTASVGLLRQWTFHRGHGARDLGHVGLAIGLSYRGIDDFGGSGLQRHWHEVSGLRDIKLPRYWYLRA